MTEAEALLFSIAIEVPVAALVAAATRWAVPWRAGLALAIATGVTHPQLWALALLAYPRFGYWPSILALEAAVVLAEAAIAGFVLGLRPYRALLLSLAANGASFVVGKLVFG